MHTRLAATFDAWDPPESRLEALAFGLFAVRRGLTQGLVGLPERLLWRAEDGVAAAGEVARGAWDREFHWLWPLDLDAPELPATPTLVEVFYGFVRHRAVTEELLMSASDEDLSRRHESRVTLGEPSTLASALLLVAEAELADLPRLHELRTRLQPEWAGIGELNDRATRALLEARAAAEQT